MKEIKLKKRNEKINFKSKQQKKNKKKIRSNQYQRQMNLLAITNWKRTMNRRRTIKSNAKSAIQ